MHAQSSSFFAALVLVAVATAVGYIFKRRSGAPFFIHRWADDHGFRILSCQFRYLAKGPFTLNSQRRHEVYRVKVRDSDGRERSAWVRSVLSFGSDNAEVVWDE